MRLNTNILPAGSQLAVLLYSGTMENSGPQRLTFYSGKKSSTSVPNSKQFEVGWLQLMPSGRFESIAVGQTIRSQDRVTTTSEIRRQPAERY